MARFQLLSTTAAFAFFANIAMADDTATSVSKLPDSGVVTVSGVVGSIKNGREFILRDNTGATVDVEIVSADSTVLKEGDKITVKGNVRTGLFGLMGKTIDASTIETSKDLGTNVSDAITKTTGISLDHATTATIGQLPDKGLVKVTGIVVNVASAKSFTVKDSTGKVDVDVKSNENAVVSEGAEVIITGYVNDGLLGKSINATHVIISSNPPSPHADAM